MSKISSLKKFTDKSNYCSNTQEKEALIPVLAGHDVAQEISTIIENSDLQIAVSLLANDKKNLLVVNTDLEIIYASKAVHYLFNGYYHIQKKPFFNVFKNILKNEDLQILLDSIYSKEQGFSWVGIVTHQTNAKRQIYTHMNIMPLFGQEHCLIGFLISFEDMTEGIRDSNRRMLMSLLEASKLKDSDTGFHNERVNYYSRALAEELCVRHIFPQIDSEYVEKIGFFAAMHDIGKIGIPDDILQKQSKLTEEEWKVMRQHTINGFYILAFYPDPMVREIALSHHERWDGTGYPYGLQGEMIPLSARIVMVTDVYDALRMKRCYKPAFSHEKTIQLIIEGRASHFDPQIVDVFKECHQKLSDIFDQITDTFDSVNY